MAKRILIIGAGIEQIYGYKLAREMGIKTVGTDMNLDAPAFQFTDDKIIASTTDAQESWEEVKKCRITLIVYQI